MNLLDKFHFKDKNGIQTTMEICDSFSRSKIAEVVGMIPTKVSQLVNDSGYALKSYVDQVANSIPTKTSQLQNDSGFTTFSGNYNDLTNKPSINIGTISNWNSWLTNVSGSVNRYDKTTVLYLNFDANRPSISQWHHVCNTSIRPPYDMFLSVSGMNSDYNAIWLKNGEVNIYMNSDNLDHNLHLYGICIY